MKPLVAVATLLALSCFQLSLCQTEKEHKLVAANNDFAIHLLKVLPSLPNENVFFSPYSLSTALGMTLMGARGDTLEEMSQTLGYSALSLSESDIREAFALQNNRLQAHARQAGLEVANSAAVQQGFNVIDSYYDALNRTFNAHVFNVDFQSHGQQAVDTINEWVKQATHNKIDKLFNEPLETDTRLVLMNAILFKGFWERQFNPNETTKQKELQSKLLELPYRDSDYSMVIVLPEERDGADAVKQVLTINKLNLAIASLRSGPVAISLPKFKIDKLNPLKSNLTHLGLRKMFGSEADLSGITGDRRLYVSDVLQRAVVDVNEEGTEAAAVSGVVSVNRIGIEPFPFTADHPFLFFIRDRKTNEIFFAGQVNAL
ncbi:hypothetical protein MTO96_048284 [Rhipicephalus appendiculatus]